MKDDFAGVAHDPVLRLYDRKEMSDEDMVAYLAHCLTDIPSKRPSIETLMHSFLPYEHIDHTHADYALWFAALEGGRKFAEDIFQEDLVWVEYFRPGFHLAKTVSEAVKKNPKAKCVILAKHGLLTWGKTSKELPQHPPAAEVRRRGPEEGDDHWSRRRGRRRFRREAARGPAQVLPPSAAR
jgi:rhamnose utilization protein RhaD (predicted bifunctional aldolase and dehydrogenase)